MPDPAPTRRTQCRVCRGQNLSSFLDLGAQPHCNNFLRKEEVGKEAFYPLHLYYCNDCSLVQLLESAPAEAMFRNYPYVSGTTKTLTSHFRTMAQDLVVRLGLKPGDLVVDLGSNDGTFLKGYAGSGVRTLGVDPARNIAELARQAGIETLDEFFGLQLAKRMTAKYGHARLVTAAGVFFHLEDLHDFVAGVEHLLSDDGVFVVQAMYLLDVMENNSFDNFYHEHLCLYSLRPMLRLFEQFNLTVVDVRRDRIHGGSLTVSVRKGKGKAPGKEVAELLELEKSRGLHGLAAYHDFAKRVARLRVDLMKVLRDMKSSGKRLAAYGAPAKGNTLLNYCRIGTDLLDFAVEKNPLKCGLYTPGMHLPVIHEDEVRDHPPDGYLLLPWNFKDEILAKEKSYRDRGGVMVIPIPSPTIV